MSKLKATFYLEEKSDGAFNANHRVVKAFRHSIIAVQERTYTDGTKGLGELVEARFYGHRVLVSCCLWVHSEDVNTSGSAKVGSAGYDKDSTALGVAIWHAGFKLSEPIEGRGRSFMDKAVLAIATLVKRNKNPIYLIHAQG